MNMSIDPVLGNNNSDGVSRLSSNKKMHKQGINPLDKPLKNISEDISISEKAALIAEQESLNNERPEMIEQAKALIQDENYPSDEDLQDVSRALLSDIKNT